jgi:PhzF family phenazine biosynthesis protein
MSLPLFQVNAFTNRPFTGNPAAVCLLDDSGDPAWMQDVAREMNLAETAFLQKFEFFDGGRFQLYSVVWPISIESDP